MAPIISAISSKVAKAVVESALPMEDVEVIRRLLPAAADGAGCRIVRGCVQRSPEPDMARTDLHVEATAFFDDFVLAFTRSTAR